VPYRVTAACAEKHVMASSALCPCVVLFPWPEIDLVQAIHWPVRSRGAADQCIALGVYLP
jgi:hypothetical protein